MEGAAPRGRIMQTSWAGHSCTRIACSLAVSTVLSRASCIDVLLDLVSV